MFGLVAHTGVEPVISALRGRRPWPLDECAMKPSGYARTVLILARFVPKNQGAWNRRRPERDCFGMPALSSRKPLTILTSGASLRVFYNSKNRRMRYAFTQCVDATVNISGVSNCHVGGCLGVRKRGTYGRAYGGPAHSHFPASAGRRTAHGDTRGADGHGHTVDGQVFAEPGLRPGVGPAHQGRDVHIRGPA